MRLFSTDLLPDPTPVTHYVVEFCIGNEGKKQAAVLRGPPPAETHKKVMPETDFTSQA